MYKLILIFALLLQILFIPQTPFYPAQYVTKLYTEGLGRLPDQLGFFGYTNYFQRQGCSKFTLQVIGYQILTSAEYKNLRYDTQDRIFTIMRALLNREPTTNELNSYNGKSIEQIVDSVLKSKEFNNLVPRICKNKEKDKLARYGWDGKPVRLAPIYHAFNGTEAELRTEIAKYPYGTVFTLAQHYYVELTEPLNLYGITLQTEGNPKPNEYARMARIVRGKNFKGNNGCGLPECGEPIIRLFDGADIKNVWIEGNGNNHNYRVWDINLQTVGSHSTVENCRIDNSAGFSNIQTLGALEGVTCTNVLVKGNLITGYNSDGLSTSNPATWVDGITNSCDNAILEENSIIDSSDVGIVVFHAPRGFTQNTKVRFNNIFQAGNSTFAAMNTDHIFADFNADFSGTVFENNLLWTSDFCTMRTGLSVGSGIWGQRSGGSGFGASFINNTTGFGFIKGQFGILINGMSNSKVEDNTLKYKPFVRCSRFSPMEFAELTGTC